MKRLRIFISSPGDVAAERTLAKRVIERLQGEFEGRAELEPILWEHEPLVATSTFQDQIVRPSDTDITVSILWSRLGTRLPAQFTRSDGSRYASGTEYEFEDAVEGFRNHGKPELLVYRKVTDPVVSLSEPEELLKKLEQKKALDRFIENWFIDAEEGTLTGAFHPFEGPEAFENLLETHLRKLIQRSVPTVTSRTKEERTPKARWTAGSPFRGLQAFDVQHAEVFFGRTRATGDVIDALRQQAEADTPFVAIVGMSGGGKSSLARAGVLPMLIQPGVIEGVSLWRYGILRPGDTEGDLCDALARQLCAERGLPELLDTLGEVPALAHLLRTSPEVVPPLIRSALMLALTRDGLDGGNGRFALVVDQMEEIYTQFEEPARRAFVRAIDVLVRSGIVWAVATLRADVYPRLVELPALLDLKEGAGQYDLKPPSPSELGQIIRHPVSAAGLRLEEHPNTGERLEDVLRDAAAQNSNPLPLLEFTLEELYRHRTEDGALTLAAYHEIGGLEGSLARRAEEAFQGVSAEAQAAFPAVMRQLVAIAEAEDLGTLGARRAPRARVESTPAQSELVRALIEARLLLTDLSADHTPVVSIGHEALLRHWPRLSDLLEDDRDLLKARARLGGAARRWLEEGRSLDYVLAPGKPLEAAKEVRMRGTGLTHLEEEYLDASIHRARRFVRLRRAAFAGLALLTITAATSAWSAQRSSARADAEAFSAERTHQFTVGLLSRSGNPLYTKGEEWSVKEMLNHGTELLIERGQLADVPMTRARAMTEWARPYEVRQEYETALLLVREALALQEAESGVPDSTLGRTWRQLGAYLLELDSLDAAEPHLERAAVALAGTAAHPVALRTLGVLRLEQGRNDDAEEALKRALAASGAEADTMLQAMARGDLARIRFRKDDPEGSEQLFIEAMEFADAAEGGNRPDAYAFIARNYSILLQFAERETEADSVLARALDRLVAVFGEKHGDVAATMKRRGALARERGDMNTADQLLRGAYDVEVSVYGPDHTQPAFTSLELAQLLNDRGQFEDAEAFAQEGRRVLTQRLGAHHRRLTSPWQVLGYIYWNAGRLSEAEAAFDSARVVTGVATGTRSRDYTTQLELLGSLQAEMGKREEAVANLTEALEIAREVGSLPDETYYLERLEVAHYRMEDFATAETWAAETLRVRREALEPDDPEIARSLGDLAFYRAMAGDRVAVDTLLPLGWAIVDPVQVPNDAALWAHRTLMNAPSVLEDWDVLKVRATKLRELLEAADPPRPGELAEALMYEAEAFLSAGDRTTALPLARRGVALFEQQYGADYPLTVEARATLAELGG